MHIITVNYKTVDEAKAFLDALYYSSVGAIGVLSTDTEIKAVAVDYDDYITQTDFDLEIESLIDSDLEEGSDVSDSEIFKQVFSKLGDFEYYNPEGL